MPNILRSFEGKLRSSQDLEVQSPNDNSKFNFER